MTRQEFSKIIADYRKSKEIIIKEVCFSAKCLPTDIYRIEDATHNYNLQKCLNYLNAVGLKLKLQEKNKVVTIIDNYDALVESIVNYRKAQHTQRSLAKIIGISNSTMAFFENKKTIITIDTLLKLCEALGISISVEPIKNK